MLSDNGHIVPILVSGSMVETIDPAAYIPPLIAPAGSAPQSSGQRQAPREERRRAPVMDVAAVLELPESQLSAGMQDSFLAMVEEMERLRQEVERLAAHEKFLISAADQHNLLPVLNRRAFLAGFTRILEASERADLPGCVAYIHVGGIETVRREHGLLAGDVALTLVARVMHDELRQTDLLGYLDSSDFAVVLAVAEHAGASAKVAQIMAGLQALPLEWAGQPLKIEPRFGQVFFEPGLTAKDLLEKASQAMMSGTSALSI